MSKRKIILKIVSILGIIIITLSATIIVYRKTKSVSNNGAILSMGLTKGQGEYFAKELELTGKQYGFIRKGNILLEEGNIDAAIIEYEKALKNAYSRATKGEAITHLSIAYEKKRDYKKALQYAVLDKDIYTANWAKGPVVERVKYLEYAANGKYELAIEYARNALKADANLPDSHGEPMQQYIEGLHDLIVAKDYILSLKQE